MPVIRFQNSGQTTNTTSQQVSKPIDNKNVEVLVDNTLQLDQKIRTILGISNNIVQNQNEIIEDNKNYLLSSNVITIENITKVTDLPCVVQGSNYPIVRPKTNTIVITNSPTPIIFENIEFFSTNDEPIIKIQNNSKVLFKNCIFRKTNTSQTSVGNYVSVIAGCNVSFVGCWFMGTQTAGNAINNTGIPANVSVNGGFNTTNVVHLNTTIFGEQS